MRAYAHLASAIHDDRGVGELLDGITDGGGRLVGEDVVAESEVRNGKELELELESPVTG